jgi:hypothetical protein
MKFIDILLKEGRKEDLKKKYSNKFDEETLNWILNISDLVDYNHKYTDFILKSIPEDGDIDSLVEVGIGLINDFDRFQSQLEKKDINQYKDFVELESKLHPLVFKQKQKELESKVKKIYEDDKFLVVIPKTQESSCKYGAGTRWCTTSKGTGHFDRYTSGSQLLFYIIDKSNSKKGDYSKVAVHFDNSGNESWWDTQDNRMSSREVEVFKYAFSEITDAIYDYKKKNIGDQKKDLVTKVFSKNGTSSMDDTFISKGVTLKVVVQGFENVPDLGFGHAVGSTQIILNQSGEDKIIDQYELFVGYGEPLLSNTNNKYVFHTDIGFQGIDPSEDMDFIDLGLENQGLNTKIILGEDPESIADGIRRWIAGRVIIFAKSNIELQKKVTGGSPVWNPNRVNYGYTFGKNKGLIKKLVDWLDLGKTGTKLTFLTDIDKLERKVDNGEIQYRVKGRNDWENSGKLRGYFSSFFASAKNAGILNYRKVGNQYLLSKGPNFEAFKEGKLKAL